MNGLSSFAADLPPAAEASRGEDLELRCRATLAIVIELALSSPKGKSIGRDTSLCPSCGAPSASEKSPYCGPACREEAGFVRQVRAGLADGSIFDAERQVAMGQVLWSLLGGGYPLRQSMILERSRVLVFKRSGGKCEICGAEATSIDHVKTACNRPINLRAVCEGCTRTKPFGDADFLSSHAVSRLLTELAARIAANPPLRLCDDPATWDWRAYVADRKQAKAALSLRTECSD